MNEKKLISLLSKYSKAHEKAEQLKKDIDGMKADIKTELMFRGTQKLHVGSFKVALALVKRDYVDNKGLQDTYPDIYEQFKKTTEFARLTVKG